MGVAAETRVMLTSGQRVPIRELPEGDLETIGLNDAGKLVRVRGARAFREGRGAVSRVTFASGRTLRASAGHRLLGPVGPTSIEELRVGSRVGLARFAPEPAAPRPWPEEELVLLGQLVGGASYLSGKPLRYTTASEENSEAVCKAAFALGSEVKRYAGRGRWHQLLISRNGSRWCPAGVGKWLKGLGIHGQRTLEKRLPAAVFELPKAQVAVLLRHLWATDGSIALRSPGRKGSDRVFFSTCSAGLASDVAGLLMRFGIVARIRSDRKGMHGPRHCVDVSGAADQRTFLDEIGAFGPCVQPGMRLRIVLDSREPATHAGAPPVQAPGAIAAPPSTKEAPPAPHRWSRSDLYWDRVSRIADDGEAEMFGFRVPTGECWVADGVVVSQAVVAGGS